VPETIIAIEGKLNVLELESAGLKDICALGGNHVSDELAVALRDVGVKHLHVVFDGDAGGDEGIDALLRLPHVDGIMVTGCVAPKGNPTAKDILVERAAAFGA